MPDDVIYDVIRHYFDKMVGHMKKGDYLDIEFLGKFGLTDEKRKELEKLDEERGYKLAVNRRKTLRRRWQVSANRKKWKAFNEARVANGYPEWSFRDYCKVKKVKIDKRLKSYKPPKRK